LYLCTPQRAVSIRQHRQRGVRQRQPISESTVVQEML